MAFRDLGAGINLMLIFVFKQLRIGEVKPTIVTLQLTDMSLTHLHGKIEDVLEVEREVSIFLGRSFLTTCRTLIDVQKGELTMKIHDDMVTFNVFKAMHFQNELEECSIVSIVDSLFSTEMEHNSLDDPLEHLLLFDSPHENDEDE
ncbi:uncharacterized protein [Gossypium hirsutum]|uniref:Uncharacterized protein n=1 Tax=Gossypium hirsutum TaxID=3635 RepID=A0A1U8KPG3_GOSHI|nr:uncharacterized protein LOC107919368 [Gossypium hirsutum]